MCATASQHCRLNLNWDTRRLTRRNNLLGMQTKEPPFSVDRRALQGASDCATHLERAYSSPYNSRPYTYSLML